MSCLFLQVKMLICAVWLIAFKLLRLCRPDVNVPNIELASVETVESMGSCV